MHFVCQQVDLVVHHCGSGAYQYPILHQVSAVTLGTQCYDREEVALRLEELGVSQHLPAPEETDTFAEEFKRKLRNCFTGKPIPRSIVKEGLARLRNEMTDAAANFDFTEVLRTAHHRFGDRHGHPAKAGLPQSLAR